MRYDPPHLADALLIWALPRGVRGDSIRGDLREEYTHLRSSRGRGIAGAWFWIEALRLAARFVFMRKTRIRRGRGGGGDMGSIRDDIRHAISGLRRNPGYTFLAALTIGLGLGANTAIFAVLQAVVLKPLPYEQPERVVAVRTVSVESGGAFPTSFPQFEDYESRNRVFSSLAAWRDVAVVHRARRARDDGP